MFSIVLSPHIHQAMFLGSIPSSVVQRVLNEFGVLQQHLIALSRFGSFSYKGWTEVVGRDGAEIQIQVLTGELSKKSSILGYSIIHGYFVNN